MGSKSKSHGSCRDTKFAFLGTGAGGEIECVSVAEEGVLQEYYAIGLQRYGKSLKLPDSVEATALAFYTRFYLNNSVPPLFLSQQPPPLLPKQLPVP